MATTEGSQWPPQMMRPLNRDIRRCIRGARVGTHDQFSTLVGRRGHRAADLAGRPCGQTWGELRASSEPCAHPCACQGSNVAEIPGMPAQSCRAVQGSPKAARPSGTCVQVVPCAHAVCALASTRSGCACRPGLTAVLDTASSGDTRSSITHLFQIGSCLRLLGRMVAVNCRS